MKTLNLYILRGFLVTFFMAIAVLTFGMLGARLVNVLDFIARGIPVSSFFMFILYIMPIVLTFTIPWATMVAVMLLFGRLSADSEITAMRACGISILQIVSPILLFTLILSLFCLYLQMQVGPPLLGESRDMVEKAVIDQPLSIFEPGQPFTYEDSIIYIDDKVDENKIIGVQIYRMNNKNELSEDIFATSGIINVDKTKQIMEIELKDCRIVDKKNLNNSSALFNKFSLVIDYGNQMNRIKINKRPKYMNIKELFGRIRFDRQFARDTTELEVEINQRIAFALSPIAFLLLGLPLAIRTSRRETSVGLFLSVVLAGAFFLSIIICESLTKFTFLYPQYLLWLPSLLFQIGGAYMIYRITRH